MNQKTIEIELEGSKVELTLNRPQLRFVLLLTVLKKAVSIWGRGTGKSFIIALLMDLIVKNMPGASWAIQGATYKQILSLTLQGTLAAMEKLGYVRGVHYVWGKQPPKNWILPFEAPLNFEHYIVFFHPDRCVGFHLYSQDRKGSARGPNVDGIIADESLTLDENIFFQEAKMTNRGNDDRFGHLPYHHGIFHFSSMPYGNSGKWLLDAGKYYEKQGYNFRRLSNKLIELQLEFLKEKDPKLKLEIWPEILKLQSELRFYKSKAGMLYSEANTFENIANVGLRYIQEAYDDSTDINLFLVEVLNKSIETIDAGFYAGFDKHIHGYKGSFDYSLIDNLTLDDGDITRINNIGAKIDRDCVSNHPLEIGLDFGKINWVVVAQHFKSLNEVNFIRNIYVKSPKIIDDLAMEFCRIYEGHGRKVAHIWPDGMGNDDVANAKQTYTQQFCAILKKNDWTCVIKNKSKKNPEHHYKYLLWARCFNPAYVAKDNRYPVVKFNTVNCKELVFAMENTPAVDNGKGFIAKDKSSERKLPMAKREEATDSTDAADQILYGLFRHLVKDITPRYMLPT